MLRTSFRRSTRTRVLRAAFLIVGVVLVIDLLTFLLTRRHQSHAQAPVPNVHGQKVYIASIHWNNERILRSHWNDAVVGLVKYFGPENVYVSVHESGSWDDSKGALRLLDNLLQELRVNRTITLDPTTHLDEIQKPPADAGWIDTSRGRKELRRIPYLSKLRNLSLEPLGRLAEEGVKFDKILFLNDVVFTTDDIATLIATRDGDYAAACSLDFSKPPSYYDTFALRDDAGHEAVTPSWPFFRSYGSWNAMISGEPVPVQSCWNGVVVFDSKPFYSSSPLAFRGVPDSLAAYHLEASECCLIHADNPLSTTQGVWLNPKVRVGYNPEAYTAVHPYSLWPDAVAAYRGVWSARLNSWMTTPVIKSVRVNSRLKRWQRKDPERHEPGKQCLINEMQVLIENGWAHV